MNGILLVNDRMSHFSKPEIVLDVALNGNATANPRYWLRVSVWWNRLALNVNEASQSGPNVN